MDALTRRQFLTTSAMALAGTTLVACAPAQPAATKPAEAPKPAATQPAETPAAKPAAKEAVEVFWLSPLTSEVEKTWTHHWVDVFNEQTPHINVRIEEVAWGEWLTKIRAYLAAGEQLDISTHVNPERYKLGWVEPLDDYECIVATRDEWADIFFAKDGWGVYWENDRMIWIGVPWQQQGSALMARRDRFAEAGVTNLLEATATWEGFLETLAAVHNPPEFYGFGDELRGGTTAGAIQGVLFQSNGLYNLADFREEKREAYIECLEFLQKLWAYISPDAINWEHKDHKNAFAQGLVATGFHGSWFYGDLIPTVPDLAVREKMAVLPIPSGPHGPGQQLKMIGLAHWIFKQSKLKSEAAEFLCFMCEDDPHNSFPMNFSLKKKVDIDQQVAVLQRLYPQWYGEHSKWWYEDWYDLMQKYPGWETKIYMPSAEINKIFGDELMGLYNKTSTPEQVYDRIKPRIEAILIK